MHEIVIDGIAGMKSDDLARRLLTELDDLSAQDQVIQEIVWGDEDISASVEEFLARVHDEDRGPLVIRSMAASALLEETVTASANQLQVLVETVEQVVHHLRCGADDEAFVQLPDLFEGLQNLGPLLEMLGGRNLLPASTVKRQIDALGNTLTDLMAAWQNENYVAMADTLKFDLRSLLMQTYDILSDLAVDLTIARLSNRP